MQVSLQQNLKDLLNMVKHCAENTDIDKICEGLSEQDLKQINAETERAFRNKKIEFATKLRHYKRGYAPSTVLEAEMAQLRKLADEILVYMPTVIKVDRVKAFYEKRALDAKNRELAEKEQQMLEAPMSLDYKILSVAFAPVVIPAMAAAFWWEHYTKTNAYKKKQAKQRSKHFRRHWKELHDIQAKRNAGFRKLYNEMHEHVS